MTGELIGRGRDGDVFAATALTFRLHDPNQSEAGRAAMCALVDRVG
jgi:hypothetical protein